MGRRDRELFCPDGGHYPPRAYTTKSAESPRPDKRPHLDSQGELGKESTGSLIYVSSTRDLDWRRLELKERTVRLNLPLKIVGYFLIEVMHAVWIHRRENRIQENSNIARVNDTFC